jgi:hypothetical protein
MRIKCLFFFACILTPECWGEELAAREATVPGEHRVSYARYTNLWQSADLVVIAKAVSSWRTNKTKVFIDGTREIVGDEIVTRFKVRLILRGYHDEDTLLLIHYRVKPGTQGFRTYAPRFAKFELPPEGASDFISDDLPEYMLFLKRSSNGLYTPVSGQKESALSVRDVINPWIKRQYQARLEQSGAGLNRQQTRRSDGVTEEAPIKIGGE